MTNWTIQDVSLVSSGTQRASGGAALNVSSDLREKMQKLMQSVLKDSKVEQALQRVGGLNEEVPLKMTVDLQDGICVQVGSENVVVEDGKTLLSHRSRFGKLLDFGRLASAEVDRKGLGERISSLTERQKVCADKVSKAFAKAEEAANQENVETEGWKLPSDAKTMMKSFGAGGAVMRNQLALDLNSKKVAGFSFLDRSKVLASLGELNGSLDILGGLFSLPDTYRSWGKACSHQNREEKCLSLAAGLIGVGIVAAGGLELTEASAKLTSNADLVKSVASPLSILGGVLIGVQSIHTAYHLGVIGKFRFELNQIIDQKDVSEAQKCREALLWIRQQVTLSEFEAEEILAKAKLENRDPEEEMKLALQRKWDRFEMCTSMKNGAVFAKTITDEFLDKVKNEDPQALEDAKAIVSQVSKSNLIELGSYVFSAFLLVLAIAAFVCSHVLGSESLVSPVLGIVSASLSLVVATQKYWVKIPRMYGYQGDDSFFGEKLWEFRNKWFSNSDRIDRVSTDSCTKPSSRISPIISSLKKGNQETPSALIDAML